MSTLRSEIEANYLDMYYLVSPHKASIPKQRESDNGNMFSSEYYIYLKLNEELQPFDVIEYEALILKSELLPGLISRCPNDPGRQPPDDFLGICAACSVLGITTLPRRMIDYGVKHLGFFNNENPGSVYRKNTKEISWEALLWRQPQLIAAAYSAAGLGKFNPIVKLLNLYSALVIVHASFVMNKSESDSKRLTFLLIKAMDKSSFVCRLVSKYWLYKIKQYWGEDFMKNVCKSYYSPDHPFIRYAKF